MFEDDPNAFNFARHARLNANDLRKIGQEFNKNPPKTVTLKHPDGRTVIVNAHERDEAFVHFTAQGYQVQAHEQRLLETNAANQGPEAGADSGRVRELENAVSSLSAKLDALTKATAGQTGQTKGNGR